MLCWDFKKKTVISHFSAKFIVWFEVNGVSSCLWTVLLNECRVESLNSCRPLSVTQRINPARCHSHTRVIRAEIHTLNYANTPLHLWTSLTFRYIKLRNAENWLQMENWGSVIRWGLYFRYNKRNKSSII